MCEFDERFTRYNTFLGMNDKSSFIVVVVDIVVVLAGVSSSDVRGDGWSHSYSTIIEPHDELDLLPSDTPSSDDISTAESDYIKFIYIQM